MTNAYAIPGLKIRPEIFNVPQERIINTILKYKGVTWNEITTRNRKRKYVYVRHLLCYFLITYKEFSDQKTANLLSPAISERTTALHGRNTIKNLISHPVSDAEVKADIKRIKELLTDV